MHTSELFLTFVRRLIFSFFVILLVATASRAQETGHTAISTREVSVFTAQSSTTHSAILPDFGFAAQTLFVANTAFTGTIDLEWSPTGATPFYTLTIATYNNDSANHILQLGGYWPNLRSSVTVTTGSVSAWYTASAAPIPYTPPAIGSTGPASPIQCDQFQTASVLANGSFTSIATSSTRGFAICGFTISFTGATSTGGVQVGWGTSGACSGGVYPWFIATQASTPQAFTVGSGLGAMFQLSTHGSGICVDNHSGSGLEIAIWYALL